MVVAVLYIQSIIIWFIIAWLVGPMNIIPTSKKFSSSLILFPQFVGHGLECFCNQYPYSFKGNDCQLRGNKCFSSITCVVQHALLDDGIIVKTHVCYNLSVRLSKDYCSRYDSKISRACCSDSDGCNEFLIPRMLEVEMATPSPANPTLEGSSPLRFVYGQVLELTLTC